MFLRYVTSVDVSWKHGETRLVSPFARDFYTRLHAMDRNHITFHVYPHFPLTIGWPACIRCFLRLTITAALLEIRNGTRSFRKEPPLYTVVVTHGSPDFLPCESCCWTRPVSDTAKDWKNWTFTLRLEHKYNGG